MADNTKGLIMVNTGNGKGKTTAALGLIMRAWGNGFRTLILQFIKGSWQYGELKTLKHLAPLVEVHQVGEGFSRRGGDQQKHIDAANAGLRQAKIAINSGKYDLIVLDELNYALDFGLVKLEDVLELLDNKPEKLHLLLTGRNAKPEIIQRADLVTEMKEIKHPYHAGIKAQKGIEF